MAGKTVAIALCVALAVQTTAFSDEYDEVSAAVFEEDNIPAAAAEIDIPAPSAILIEKETGQVIYEKNADERLEPASVTKVMTILLIVEAVDNGTISLDDTVTVSAYAESMGGSQVYLEEGEKMKVSEMLKCVVVVSANDAAVAMAEHIAGTEQAFVTLMNERAGELGMTNTHFGNCTGLLDDSAHLTTARDIAIMSRELIKHEWIKDYTTIWMDSIRDGEFGLSNTNKMIYYYSGATGLKTGYTSSAGHCLSATAERDGVEYIAVVLNCGTSSDRFESAKTLLSYAFANYTLISAVPDSVIPPIKVNMGKTGYVQPVLESNKSVLVRKSEASSVKRETELSDSLEAPVEAGEILGELVISLNGETLCRTELVAPNAVERIGWSDIFRDLVSALL